MIVADKSHVSQLQSRDQEGSMVGFQSKGLEAQEPAQVKGQ